MNRDDFETRLRVILRDAGPGAVAELSDTVIAYLLHDRVAYAGADLAGDAATIKDADAILGNWAQWDDWLTDWLTDPVISIRGDLADSQT